MTEHKFTDEEIIMDLQNASEWFKEHGKNTNTAIIGICERAVDLINRQKAEIEDKSKRLRNVLPIVAELKAEAVKEFAEMLKKYYRHINKTAGALIEYTIDQKLKEYSGCE
jgi:predicted transcriptional regulator